MHVQHLCVCMYIKRSTWSLVCRSTWIFLLQCGRKYACMYVNIHALYVCVYIYNIHTYTHSHTDTHIHPHAHSCIHAHEYRSNHLSPDSAACGLQRVKGLTYLSIHAKHTCPTSNEHIEVNACAIAYICKLLYKNKLNSCIHTQTRTCTQVSHLSSRQISASLLQQQQLRWRSKETESVVIHFTTWECYLPLPCSWSWPWLWPWHRSFGVYRAKLRISVYG